MALPKQLQQLSYYQDGLGRFNNYKFIIQKLRHNFNNKSLIQNLFEIQKGICSFCQETLALDNDNTEIHHIFPLKICSNNKQKTIANKRSNLRLLHETCHKMIHSNETYHLNNKYNGDYFIKHF
jgi:5-methylcytosine-specific restriction endonuclease McrA